MGWAAPFFFVAGICSQCSPQWWCVCVYLARYADTVGRKNKNKYVRLSGQNDMTSKQRKARKGCMGQGKKEEKKHWDGCLRDMDGQGISWASDTMPWAKSIPPRPPSSPQSNKPFSCLVFLFLLPLSLFFSFLSIHAYLDTNTIRHDAIWHDVR